MAVQPITGTIGNDNLSGTSGGDIFSLRQGGDDTASGLTGDDTFYMGASFTALDAIDGGADFDRVFLRGNYSSGVVFNATTMTNVEVLRLGGAFDYTITTHDATVAAGAHLTVTTALDVGNINFDGSAETDGHFRIFASAGTNSFTGGAKGDRFFLNADGDDTAYGGAGKDIFNFGLSFKNADHIDGGAGYDVLNIDGAFGLAAFSATTLINVEEIVVTADSSTDITTNDTTVAAGQTLIVNASLITTRNFAFLGGAELDGHFSITAGGPNCFIAGGAQSDAITVLAHTGTAQVTGGAGADDITFNTGVDMAEYFAASHSISTAHDTIHAFDADNDFLEIFAGFHITDYQGEVFGAVSTASFDADISAAANPALGAIGVVLVTASSGTLSGHTFVVADATGDGSYTGGSDLLIDITGYTGTFDGSEFV